MPETSSPENHPTSEFWNSGRKRGFVWFLGGVLLIFVAGWGNWLAHKTTSQSDWLVALALAVLALLAVAILWKVPQWQVARVEGLEPKERFDRRNEARKTLATLLGGVAFLVGGFFTWQNLRVQQDSLKASRDASEQNALIALDSLKASRATSDRNAQIALDSLKASRDSSERNSQIAERNARIAQESLRASQKSATDALEVSRQGQITDRFTKAVEQLGARAKFEVQLGGVYSLEAIGNESKDLHWPIIEVLCTYVRANAPSMPEASERRPKFAMRGLNERMLDTGQFRPPADIQAMGAPLRK